MSVATTISLILSASALVVSSTTAWLTLLRRGTIKMTRPRIVYFGWENTPSGSRPKIFLRCLLYSTGKRGHVIQNLYLRIKRGNFVALFGSWAYGERGQLVPGSGLFVSQEGVAYNHHFLPQDDPSTPFIQFGFLASEYTIEVWADVLGRAVPENLGTISVHLSDDALLRMYGDGVGVLFDWHPDKGEYVTEIGVKPDPLALNPPPPIRPGL